VRRGGKVAKPKYQIFVSSTYEDLKEERDTAIKAILETGNIPVGMEMFSAGDEQQWELIKRQIEDCDYYVVIVAHRYGSMDGNISYTEKEYDFAVEKKIPILGFVIDDAYRSWLDAVKTPIAVQQKMMRHTDIRTTMNIYGDVVTDEMSTAGLKVAEIAFQKNGAQAEREPS
jgi:hypothetical protein